jgi:predicted ATPase/class 3 adenylate cyclase
MEPISSFGYWLRRRRKALDLTQDELSRQLGCALGTLKKLETDERRPSKQLAERLADCLEIPATQRATFLKAARAELAVDQLPMAAPERPEAPRSTTSLPSGTVTFLFTDVEGSTKLWERHRLAMRDILARHETIVHQAIEARSGVVFKTIGDAACAAFASAPQALAAALDAQRGLQAEDWGAIKALRVRMALHSDTAEVQSSDYVGFALSRVARILNAGHGGQVLLSQSTQELVRDHLPPGAELRDLRAHRLKDLAQPEHIFQLSAPDLSADFPPLRTLDARPSNLPAQPTALIGREREIAKVCSLLRRDGVRLVTLTGPGGTGKTRLALQAAAEFLDDTRPTPLSQRESGPEGEGRFSDSVFFVNLAPISDPGLVAATIAHALGVAEVAGQSIEESLHVFLHAKRTLLLLDNFEQVLDAAPLIAELLAARYLKMLVTSRAALHLYGEHEFAVPPLELPDLAHLPPAEQLTQYEAVRLFITQAQAAKADFAMTNANAPSVAEICHRLDGLPLAIELAAARSKLFAPEALLARLDEWGALPVLTGGARDLPLRQQTMRATIAWSEQLLAPAERVFFARLAVFVGGFDLEAATTVCGDGDADVLTLVEALVAQSMVQVGEQANGAPRFRLLETIREYALERLAELEKTDMLRQHHAAYYLALAEQAEAQLRGIAQVEWFNRLEVEHSNLRAVLAWSQTAGANVEVELRLVTSLAPFWSMRGYRSELDRWLERALTLSSTASIELQARVLLTAGRAARDPQRATTLIEQSLALLREMGDTGSIASALSDLALVAFEQDDYEKAAALYNDSITLLRELDDSYHIAWALGGLGLVAQKMPDEKQAAALFEESLALRRELGDTWGVAWTLSRLQTMALAQRNYERARVLEEEALALYRRLGTNYSIVNSLFDLWYVALHQGDLARTAALFAEILPLRQELDYETVPPAIFLKLGALARFHDDAIEATRYYNESLLHYRILGKKAEIGLALRSLGALALREGDSKQAAALFTEGLELYREMEDKEGITLCLTGLAGVAGAQSRPKRATRLFGLAEALRDELGLHLDRIDRPDYDRSLAATRALLDEATFAVAWAEGRTMTLEQAIAYALSLTTPVPTP